MIFSGITFNPSDVCTLKRFGTGVFLNLLNTASTDTNTLKEVYANEQSAGAHDRTKCEGSLTFYTLTSIYINTCYAWTGSLRATGWKKVQMTSV